MRIIVDENIPLITVNGLRELGHDVMDIRGTELEGIPDRELWNIVKKEGRLLITTDKGFMQNRYEKHHGILIIRLKQPNRSKINQKALKGITLFSEKEWPLKTVVMQDLFHSVWKNKTK